ncbi:epidermal patterning factor-like protein 2, partial [Phtheirospermum japonicum]
ILRARIGSQPPRCERRCSSCGHCEAIQVPTNPQIRRRREIANSTAVSVIAYARGDDNSNYKPMSWKCKCGNLIFNP